MAAVKMHPNANRNRPADSHSIGKLLVHTAWLLASIAVVGAGCYVVLKQSRMDCDGVSVAMATLAVALALVPPLWLECLAGTTVAAPVATVAWRLGILLPVILYSNYQTEPARNCAQVTLLACYLMTLPLESWLLIRQSRSRP